LTPTFVAGASSMTWLMDSATPATTICNATRGLKAGAGHCP
jgi:hypothetical protein